MQRLAMKRRKRKPCCRSSLFGPAEENVEVLAVLAPARAAAIGTAIVSVRTRVAAAAVDEVVAAGLAAGFAVGVLAEEDTGLEVGEAAVGGADVHGVALGEDLAGDVKCGAPALGVELAPGVVDLADVVETRLVTVERGPGPRDAGRDGDGDAVAGVGQRDGDLGAAHVDAHGLVVLVVLPGPEDEGDGLLVGVDGVVGELEGVRALGADPGLAVGAERVLALAGHADLGHVLAVGLEQVRLETAAGELGGLVVVHDHGLIDPGTWMC